MAVGKVTEVLDPKTRDGIGKNGKPWSQAKVKLDSGDVAYVFNPVEIGDVLESYDNNGYTNWRRAKAGAYGESTSAAPKAAPAASNELLELVKDNNRMLKQLVGDVDDDTPDFGDL